MIIIPIIRSSVKPNPDRHYAGQVERVPIGRSEISFTMSGNIPDWVYNDPQLKIYQVTGHDVPPFHIGQHREIGGVFADSDNWLEIYERLKPLAENGVEITIESRRETLDFVHSRTSPAFIGKHYPVKLKCCRCGSMVNVDTIESDTLINGDDNEYDVDICPICGMPDTFPEYKYESVDKVAKELGL